MDSAGTSAEERIFAAQGGRGADAEVTASIVTITGTGTGSAQVVGPTPTI